VLALQNEVTRDIAEHVAATLRPQAGKTSGEDQHVSAEAYENYLKGRYYLAKRNPEALQRAIEYFQKAIDIDPKYALAYVGLADTYNVISFYGGPPPSESFPKAEVAAKKALALNSRLGEGHAALGDTLFSYHWDWSGAEREFREAIAINPGDASAHHWYSELLSMLGRHDEAIEQIKEAKQLDPLSLVINTTVSGALYLARRFDEAEKQIKETLDLDPDYGPAHGTLGWIYLYEHKNAQAVLEFKEAITLSGNSPSALAALGCAYASEGDSRRARSIAAELEVRSKHQYVSPEALARLYVSMKNQDLAIARLEEAYQMRVDTLNNIYVEPCYDNLRSDPRFQSLIRRMHFIR
jgi:tetratricopeptide (TPR) repeat protein